MQSKTLLRREDQASNNNAVRNQKETKLQLGFRIFSLGTDEADVKVNEVNEIDFDDIKRRLKSGESIFIGVI